MNINKRKLIFSLLLMALSPTPLYAADMLGNPSQIGTPGAINLHIGGGQSDNLTLDFEKTTGTTQIAGTSKIHQIPAGTSKYKENQVFFGISYTLNTRTELFASLGNGKDDGQLSSSRAIGVKISPDSQKSAIRMGLILKVQQINNNYDGDIFLSPTYSATDTHFYFGAVNGSERLEYTRMDAFFGGGTSGAISFYGGFNLSYISGKTTLSIDDIASGSSTLPPGFFSNQPVTFNTSTNISGNKYFSGVLGISFNPNSDLGLTTEVQAGLQSSILLSGNIKF